jgi:hypothetical protein
MEAPDDPADTDRRIEIQNAEMMGDLVRAMAPSAQERLAGELDRAGSALARHALLTRWVERDRQAMAIAASFVQGARTHPASQPQQCLDRAMGA